MLKPVIAALDVNTEAEALRIADLLGGRIDVYKVGPVLFYKYGRKIIDELNRRGKKVFLDVKLYDIPNTVKIAVETLQEIDIYAVTVHLSGGEEMLKKVASLKRRPLIWGVSVLTSFDDSALKTLGFSCGAADQVDRLVKIGLKNNVDGIVSSAHELENINKLKKECGKTGVKCIVPGIRLHGGISPAGDDQKRVMTPTRAIKMGADFLVIGRPILESKDPVKTVEEIYEEMEMRGESER